MSAEDQTIDYESLAQDAMRGVVRAVLQRVLKHGLPGDHHFYIAFDTQAPGVTLSPRLKAKYPEEMTVVLQHRFWDLHVTNQRFEIKLTFDNIPERLVVPFKAIKVFFDPSVPYGLQFEEPEAAGASGHHRSEAGPHSVAGGGARKRSGRLTNMEPRGAGTSKPARTDRPADASAPVKKRRPRVKTAARKTDKELVSADSDNRAVTDEALLDNNAPKSGRTNKKRAMQGDNDQRKLRGPSPLLADEEHDGTLEQRPGNSDRSQSAKPPEEEALPEIEGDAPEAEDKFDKTANVVSLDAFRKK